MKWTRKAGIGILAFIAIALLLGVGVNFWIKYQLPKMIGEKNRSPYSITYKNLNYSLIDGYIKAEGIILLPKAAVKDTLVKSGIYATVQSVEIKNFKLWSVLFSDRIKARSITIIKPEVIFYKKSDKAVNPKNIRNAVVEPFGKVISVNDVYLYNGDVKIVYIKAKKAILNISNINIQLDGIAVDDQTLGKKIPFTFEKYSVKCDSLYYRANEFYHFTTQKISATDSDVKIAQFKMIPEYARREFVKKIDKEKDLFVISAKDVHLRNLDWGFRSDVLFANVNSVNLDGVNADIYRNKLPADDLSKKFLYNKLLRDLDFNLRIDTLKIRNSLLAYEEEKDFYKGSGKLIFNKFNLTAINVCSGFQKKKLPDLKIHVSCKFMDTSPLKVDWKLNVMDKSDGFNIKGSIMAFDSKKIDAFTKPYINATTEGTLNEVYFNFTGNDAKAHGKFAIKYDDFKVTFYQKNNREKKNRFLTSVGNLFVKNDTKGQVKGTEVELDRIPEKSFYNFLWRSIAEGLRKIFI